jgi:formate hydrogenlyase transcriptional activator
VTGISEKSMKQLQSYRWPGNIRELENVLERALILADSDVIEVDPDMLSGRTKLTSKSELSNAASYEAVTRHHLLAVLEQTNWVIEGANGAAHILNMHPSTLRYRMKKLGLAKASH